MIGAEKMRSQQAIKEYEGPVQVHVLALISSTYYLWVNKITAVDKNVLTRMANAFVDGYAGIFDADASSESARRNALSVYELVVEYTSSLSNELDAFDPSFVGDNPFDMGPTARLVVRNIAGQCGIQELLAESSLERFGLEMIARDCGLFALLRLLAGKQNPST